MNRIGQFIFPLHVFPRKEELNFFCSSSHDFLITLKFDKQSEQHYNHQ